MNIIQIQVDLLDVRALIDYANWILVKNFSTA